MVSDLVDTCSPGGADAANVMDDMRGDPERLRLGLCILLMDHVPSIQNR